MTPKRFGHLEVESLTWMQRVLDIDVTLMEPLLPLIPGESRVAHLARSLAYASHRATADTRGPVPLILWPASPLPDWVGKVVVKIVDLESDEAELSVFDASGRIVFETWRIDAGASFESVAAEILAILPTQDLVVPLAIGGHYMRLLEIKEDWRRVWISNFWGASGLLILAGLPACALGIVVVALAIPGGVPAALLGVLGVPLGSAVAAAVTTLIEARWARAKVRSRAKRLGATRAPDAGPTDSETTLPTAPTIDAGPRMDGCCAAAPFLFLVPFVIPILIAWLVTR